MIECANCETSQFLEIVSSRIKMSQANCEIAEVIERYRCVHCGAKGEQRFDRTHGVRINGDVRENDDISRDRA